MAGTEPDFGPGGKPDFGETVSEGPFMGSKPGQPTENQPENDAQHDPNPAMTVPGENRHGPTLGQRVREVIQEAGGLTAVARQTKIAKTTLQRFMYGQEMRASDLVALARATGVRLDWLAMGEGPKAAPGPAGNIDFGRVRETFPDVYGPPPQDRLSGYAILPRYDVQASAGEGAVVSTEQVVEFLAFREDWLRDNIRRPRDALSLIEARGDSMEPTIRHRDLLIVDTSDRAIANGAIHVVEVDGQLLVKRLERRLDGTVVVHSDNRRYAPETLDARTAGGLRVVGQVVWQGGPVRS